MRRHRFVISLIALALLVGSLSGCDNRSKFEKDVDKTAAKVKDVFK
jgi:predicted small secreted protein